MHQITKVFFTFIALIYSCALPLFSLDVYEYENTRGSERYSSFLYVSPSKTGYEIDVKLSNQELKGFVTENYSIRTFRFIDACEKISLEVEGKGDV